MEHRSGGSLTPEAERAIKKFLWRYLAVPIGALSVIGPAAGFIFGRVVTQEAAFEFTKEIFSNFQSVVWAAAKDTENARLRADRLVEETSDTSKDARHNADLAKAAAAEAARISQEASTTLRRATEEVDAATGDLRRLLGNRIEEVAKFIISKPEFTREIAASINQRGEMTIDRVNKLEQLVGSKTTVEVSRSSFQRPQVSNNVNGQAELKVRDIGIEDGQHAILIVVANAVQTTPSQRPAGSGVQVQIMRGSQICGQSSDFNYSSGALAGVSASATCLVVLSPNERDSVFTAKMSNGADAGNVIVAQLEMRHLAIVIK